MLANDHLHVESFFKHHTLLVKSPLSLQGRLFILNFYNNLVPNDVMERCPRQVS